MSEKNSRKASEILLNLESKITILSFQMQNIDTNIKLILNRLAGSNTDIILPSKALSENIIENSQNLIKIDEIENKNDTSLSEISTTSSGKKVAVQQRIVYPDGKNICLATVEIKNKSGQIIKKIKTNAMGKWMAAIEVGEYSVHIVKSANKLNRNVELSYNINVPDSDRPIELPSPKT